VRLIREREYTVHEDRQREIKKKGNDLLTKMRYGERGRDRERRRYKEKVCERKVEREADRHRDRERERQRL
jgi:hypothetical protein